MEAIPYVDALVKEYLLFRGFTKTLQAFTADTSTDKGCGFQAEQISNLIFGRLIPQHDGLGLVDLLKFLRTHIFSRLNSDFEGKASKLELSILRLYIVHAIDSEKAECVQQLFEAHGEHFSKGAEASEWESWFSLLFLQKPQADPRFQVYFTKPWKQLVEASFRNYVAKAVTELPLPAILRFNADRKQRQALQARAAALQAELDRLKSREQQPGSTRSLDLNPSNVSPAPLRVDPPRSSSPWADLATPASSQSQSLLQISWPREEAQPEEGAEDGGMATLSPLSQALTTPGCPGWVSHNVDATSPGTVAGSLATEAAGELLHPRDLSTTAPRLLETSLLLSDMSDSDMEGSSLLLEQLTEDRSSWAGRKQLADPNTDSQSSGLHGQHTCGVQSREKEQTSRGSSGSQEPGKSQPAVSPLRTQSLESEGSRSIAGHQESLRGHEAAVSDVIFSPDGRNAASASADGVVRIWAPTSLSGNADRSAVLLCGAPVVRLAWDNRADKVMLMGTEGKGIKAWHLDTKRMVAHMRPDAAFPDVCDLACSPTDPSFLCSSASSSEISCRGRLSLWNLRAFRKAHVFKGDVRLPSVCFSPDSRTVAAAGDDGVMRLFDTSMSVSTASLPIGQTKDGPSFVRFVGSNGTSLLTHSPDGILRGWDFAMLRGPTWTMDVSRACSGGAAQLNRFAAPPNGAAAALTSTSGVQYVVSGLLEEGAHMHTAAVHSSPILATAWHPSEKVIISGSADRTLTVTHLPGL